MKLPIKPVAISPNRPADIIPFSEDDEKAIQAGARQLVPRKGFPRFTAAISG